MNIGIIGLGSAGMRHADNAGRGRRRWEKKIKVAAVYDPDMGRQEDACRVFSELGSEARDSPKKTIGQDIVNIVGGLENPGIIISSPASTHMHWIGLIDAFNQNKGRDPIRVFVEKPLRDVWQRDRAVSHTPVMVGYNWLWNSQIRRMMRSDPVPVTVQATVITDMRAWPGRDYGHPLAECSHEFAVLRKWLGALEPGAYLSDKSGMLAAGWARDRQTRWSVDISTNRERFGRRWLVDGLYPTYAEDEPLRDSYREELWEFSNFEDASHETYEIAKDVATLCDRLLML